MVPRRRRVGRRSARGTVMVLFAMVSVVLLGMLALIIELGIARNGRERMMAASDAAALEVMRERDFVHPALGSDDPFLRDQDRRLRNRLMASWPFAGDGLEQSYSETPEGAGTYFTLESELDPEDNPMNRGLVIGESGSSIPVLQANEGGNLKHGDIVSGRFTGHDSGSPVGYGGNPIHREGGDYDRVDFQPASSAEAPFADSVLVRMRRTVPYGGQGTSPWSVLDVQGGVSSSGYTMPLLFGLGTPFTAQDPSGGYSVRHHGLAMRATSIAQARPAVRIGVGSSEPGFGEEWRVGAGPIAIRRAEWNLDSPWQSDTFQGQATFSALVRLETDYSMVSIDHDSQILAFLQPIRPWQVGDAIYQDSLQPTGPQDANLEEAYWQTDECFAPLYLFGLDDQPGSNNDISEYHACGFVRVALVPAEQPSDEEPGIYLKVFKLTNTLTPGEPWIASRNAGAAFDGHQPSLVFPQTVGGDGFLAGKEWSDLVQVLFDDPVGDSGPHIIPGSRVYAPALVR